MTQEQGGKRAYFFRLLDNLKRLSRTDLDELCFNLGIDPSHLPTVSLSTIDLSRELILHLDRLGRIGELARWGNERFPNMSWFDGTTTAVSAVCYVEPRILEAPQMLFGRDELVSEVEYAMGQSNRVLLTGLAGIGKTAVAAAIAERHITRAQGQVIWLKVGEAGADDLIEAMAESISKKDAVSGLANDAKQVKLQMLLEEASHTRPLMVVFDNVWNGSALREALQAIPDATPVLATSRQRLPLDLIIEVEELPAVDALKLLSHHAGYDLSNDRDAADLCRRLGYHCYALEIAGATLKVDVATPSQLLRRIADAPHILPMPEDFAREKHESVKDLLDSSFAALDETARKVFVAMGGLFSTVLSAEPLSIYLESDLAEIEQALRFLARRSLVRQRPATDNYVLHDLTYSYARAQFAAQQGDSQAMVAAVESFVFRHLQDYDLLAAELPNILGAAGASTDQRTQMRLMCGLVVGGYPRPEGLSYMTSQGHTVAMLNRLDQAIAAAEALEGDEQEALHYLHSKRGEAHFDRAEWEGAQRAYLRALELAPTSNRRAKMLATLGTVSDEQDLGEDAERYLTAAYALAKQTHDDEALAFVLQHLTLHADKCDDVEAAWRYALENVTLARKVGNPVALAYALNNLGTIEKDRQNIERALELHYEALQLARDGRNLDLLSTAYESLAEDHHELGRRKEAQQFFALALDTYRQNGQTGYASELATFMQTSGYAEVA